MRSGTLQLMASGAWIATWWRVGCLLGVSAATAVACGDSEGDDSTSSSGAGNASSSGSGGAPSSGGTGNTGPVCPEMPVAGTACPEVGMMCDALWDIECADGTMDMAGGEFECAADGLWVNNLPFESECQM